MKKYSEQELKKLAIKRYGNDLHLFAKQRDGFIQGFKKALSINEDKLKEAYADGFSDSKFDFDFENYL